MYLRTYIGNENFYFYVVHADNQIVCIPKIIFRIDLIFISLFVWNNPEN